MPRAETDHCLETIGARATCHRNTRLSGTRGHQPRLKNGICPKQEVGESTKNADDEASGMSDFLIRDGEVTDDKNEDVDVEGAVPEALLDAGVPAITPINGIVQCGEFRWRRVEAIANDTRADHREFDFALRNVSLTENTSLNELL
jgi:hypothetical protein